MHTPIKIFMKYSKFIRVAPIYSPLKYKPFRIIVQSCPPSKSSWFTTNKT